MQRFFFTVFRTIVCASYKGVMVNGVLLFTRIAMIVCDQPEERSLLFRKGHDSYMDCSFCSLPSRLPCSQASSQPTTQAYMFRFGQAMVDNLVIDVATEILRTMRHLADHIKNVGFLRRGSTEENERLHKTCKTGYLSTNRHIDSMPPQLIRSTKRYSTDSTGSAVHGSCSDGKSTDRSEHKSESILGNLQKRLSWKESMHLADVPPPQPF